MQKGIIKGETKLIGMLYWDKDGNKHFVPVKQEIMTENQVLADRVLIRAAVETQRASGLIVDDSKEKPVKGEVVLVGPGTKDVTMVVEPGDTVLFGKYSGIDVELPEGKFLLMRQDDIFMITNKNKK